MPGILSFATALPLAKLLTLRSIDFLYAYLIMIPKMPGMIFSVIRDSLMGMWHVHC